MFVELHLLNRNKNKN